MILNKKELLIIEYALKQLRSDLNKDIMKATQNGINCDKTNDTLLDINYVLKQVEAEINNQ